MDESFLTITQLASRLQVSRQWLYRLVQDQQIPFYHLGKGIRFAEQEIQEWLKEKAGKPWHRDQ